MHSYHLIFTTTKTRAHNEETEVMPEDVQFSSFCVKRLVSFWIEISFSEIWLQTFSVSFALRIQQGWGAHWSNKTPNQLLADINVVFWSRGK
jgi:hypothetical protein